jgi:hypothetical protein
MNGLVDQFWLWRRFGLPAVAVLMAVGMTVCAWGCAQMPDRLLGCGLAVLGGYTGGVWMVQFARRHSRPVA